MFGRYGPTFLKDELSSHSEQKMEEAHYSKMLGPMYRTKWHHTPQYSNFHSHHYENLMRDHLKQMLLKENINQIELERTGSMEICSNIHCFPDNDATYQLMLTTGTCKVTQYMTFN
jgi:hypothetical protein